MTFLPALLVPGLLGLWSRADAASPEAGIRIARSERAGHTAQSKNPSVRDIIGRWTPVDEPDCSKNSLAVMTVTAKRLETEATQEGSCEVFKWEPAEDAQSEKASRRW
jgi:hypothetical protein